MKWLGMLNGERNKPYWNFLVCHYRVCQVNKGRKMYWKKTKEEYSSREAQFSKNKFVNIKR